VGTARRVLWQSQSWHNDHAYGAAEVIIDHSADGTTVVLRSRQLPRLPLRSV
jgi:hypothetical protein